MLLVTLVRRGRRGRGRGGDGDVMMKTMVWWCSVEVETAVSPRDVWGRRLAGDACLEGNGNSGNVLALMLAATDSDDDTRTREIKR